MHTFYQQEIPYQPDSRYLFDQIRDLPWAIFLDSCTTQIYQGRYDILSADPFLKITTQGESTHIENLNKLFISTENPFDLLQAELEKYSFSYHPQIPFAGGALGYLSYDLARRLEKLPSLAKKLIPVYDMAIGFYDWAIVNDHELKQTFLVSHLTQAHTLTFLNNLLLKLSHLVALPTPCFSLTNSFHSLMSFTTYQACFHKIKNYILEGDCYQVNLAQCFKASFEGDPYGAFLQLRQKNPAPYSAYLCINNQSIISCSPELFIKTRNQDATTKPIKGTIKREEDLEQDRLTMLTLQQSTKDRAENLMIVDLLRNDFGKVCLTGSIQVPELFAVESFKKVHHLVSTVTGKLDSPLDSLALLKACFPGGSITGAPKLRAMEIIEELEPIRRGIYCGNIGYIGFDGQTQFNIAIRSLISEQQDLYTYAGGAIVHDSQLKSEHDECTSKIAGIIEGLG